MGRRMNEGACNCIPAFALDYAKFNAGHMMNFTDDMECTFEDLSAQECYDEITNFKSKSQSEIRDECLCTEPCHSTTYTTSYSSTSNGLSRLFEELLYSRDYDETLHGISNTNNTIQEEIRDWNTEIRAQDPTMKYLIRTLQAYSMYNGLEYEELKATDTELVTEGIVVIQIFFENMLTVDFDESPGDMASSVVSDLGGQLGLWLGISMVSLMEVVLCCGAVIGGAKSKILRIGQVKIKRPTLVSKQIVVEEKSKSYENDAAQV